MMTTLLSGSAVMAMPSGGSCWGEEGGAIQENKYPSNQRITVALPSDNVVVPLNYFDDADSSPLFLRITNPSQKNSLSLLKPIQGVVTMLKPKAVALDDFFLSKLEPVLQACSAAGVSAMRIRGQTLDSDEWDALGQNKSLERLEFFVDPHNVLRDNPLANLLGLAQQFSSLRFLALSIDDVGHLAFFFEALPDYSHLDTLKIQGKKAFQVVLRGNTHSTLKTLSLKDMDQPLPSVIDILTVVPLAQVRQNYPQLEQLQIAALTSAEGTPVFVKRQGEQTVFSFEKFSRFNTGGSVIDSTSLEQSLKAYQRENVGFCLNKSMEETFKQTFMTPSIQAFSSLFSFHALLLPECSEGVVQQFTVAYQNINSPFKQYPISQYNTAENFTRFIMNYGLKHILFMPAELSDRGYTDEEYKHRADQLFQKFFMLSDMPDGSSTGGVTVGQGDS